MALEPSIDQVPLKTSPLSKLVDKWENDWPAISAWRRLCVLAPFERMSSRQSRIFFEPYFKIEQVIVKNCKETISIVIVLSLVLKSRKDQCYCKIGPTELLAQNALPWTRGTHVATQAWPKGRVATHIYGHKFCKYRSQKVMNMHNSQTTFVPRLKR